MRNMMRIPDDKDPFADSRRWTIEDCRKLEATGLIERDAYELLDGVIAIRQGRTVAHAYSHKAAFLLLTEVFGADCVLPGCSIAVDAENDPEPDVLVLLLPVREYAAQDNPTPADLRQVVEVEDVTLWRDRNTEKRLCGSAGVPEYWVLDVNGHRLYVYRQPTATGYADEQGYGEAARVAPLAAPNSPIKVSDLLP